MGAKQSRERELALTLVAQGETVAKAAKLAGINRTYLHNLLKKIHEEKQQKLENSSCNVGLNDIE
jgi:hypothetical protein